MDWQERTNFMASKVTLFGRSRFRIVVLCKSFYIYIFGNITSLSHMKKRIKGVMEDISVETLQKA